MTNVRFPEHIKGRDGNFIHICMPDIILCGADKTDPTAVFSVADFVSEKNFLDIVFNLKSFNIDEFCLECISSMSLKTRNAIRTHEVHSA